MKHFTFMKRWALLTSVMFIGIFSANAQCTWTLDGFDSFGDGWNGGSLAVTLDGTPVPGSPFSAAGTGTSWSFTVGVGQTIDLTWASGSFDGEVSFNLLDDTGATVFSQGANPPVGLVYSGLVTCTPCATIASNLDAGLYTATTAELTWDGVYGTTNYTVEWGLSPFTPGTGAELGSVVTPSTNATATGLMANTSYEYYVSSDCGTGWAGPFVFALPCILTTPAVLPFLDDFESSTAATAIGDAELHCSPEYKWEFTTDDQATGRNRFGSNAITALSGVGAFTLDKSVSGSLTFNEMILTIDLSNYAVGSNLAIAFDYMHHGDETHANDRVWVRGSEVDPWIEVYNWIGNASGVGVWNNVPMLDIAIPLSNAGQSPSSTFQIRFGQQDDFPAASTTSSDGVTFDNVQIFNITCPQPVAFSLTGADTTTASLTWTEAGGATEWQFEYGPAGFTPGTGTFVTSMQNPDTLTGLTPYSFYEVYVQAVCGPGDSSFWTGPITFNTFDQGLYMVANTECPTSGFIDIAPTGVLNTLGDDGEVTVTLPFSLLYQGLQINDVTIGSNGAIALAGGQQVGFSNGSMTTAANGLYPFWDDLGPEEAGEGVFYQTIGTAPNQQFIVQWNKDHLSGNGDTYIFQLIIDQATNEIFYVYDVVEVNSTPYDFGGSATIGVAGPNQDIQLSLNNTQYLTDNTCAHFYYTDCPNPTNYAVTYTTTSEGAITWNAGLANETNWTVVYGLQGFDPLLTGTTVQTTGTALIIPGLDDATCYDVYIYADCNPTLQSEGFMGTFCTLPNCADVTGLAGTTAVDSIFTSWNFTPNAGFPITEFAMEYGLTGFNNGSGTYVWGIDTVTYVDTAFDASLIGGALYDVYLQSICGTDSSYWVGPITVTMPLTNDSTCLAEELAVDGTVYTFNGAGATVGTGETTLAPGAGTCTGNMTWCNSSMTATTWFTFTAPASGNVRIDGEAVGFDGQLAVYETTDCNDYAQYTLLGANDDSPLGGSAPYLNLCGLTPGNTYYVVHDPFSTVSTGIYSLRLQDIVVEAGTDNGLLNICLGDTVDLSTQLTGADAGGTWSETIPTAGFNDPIWSSAGLASQVFTFEYMVVDGCAVDSVGTSVEVYAPSSAGNDGTVTVCLNEPVDLLSGLSGNVDLGGTWYDPANNSLPNSAVDGGVVPGQFNYDYITGNGVCPDDTANVIMIVDPTCDYLNLQEIAFEGMDIYPNPTTNVFYISNAGSSEVFNYELTDLNGKIITSKEAAINGVETTEVNVENLETGVYLIHIFNDNADKTFRVVKQ